jgi:hemin uptake protein HemP
VKLLEFLDITVMNDKSYDDNPLSEQSVTEPNVPPAETESPLSYDSKDLFQGRREIVIRHHAEDYRLRVTRNDKLILNK